MAKLTANAKARTRQQKNKGKLSAAQVKKIDAKADRILGKKGPKTLMDHY